MIIQTCAFSRTRIKEGDHCLLVTTRVGYTMDLVQECEDYISSLRYPRVQQHPILGMVHGQYGKVGHIKQKTDGHVFYVHKGMVEGLLDIKLDDYCWNWDSGRKRCVEEVAIPLIRLAQAARIQLWKVGPDLGLVDEKEEIAVSRSVYNLSGDYMKLDRVQSVTPANPSPTGWVVKTPDGYKLYRDEDTAKAIANEQLYAWTEEDVQSYLDELSGDNACSQWMATAASYLEDRGLGTDRVAHYYSCGVYDVTGLKKILGWDGWIEFLTLLQLGYKIREVHQAEPA